MDKDEKNFFEKLAGINDDETEEEVKNELLETKTENAIEELMDESEGQLTVDVYQTPIAFIIESTVAGVKPEDMDISITPESVTIKGKREKEEKIKADNYLYQECYWGKFARTIILPQEIDPDKSQAQFKNNGLLKIVLPKLNKSKVKKIKIKTD